MKITKNQEIGNDPVRTKDQEIGNDPVRMTNQKIGTNFRITTFAFRISKINHVHSSPWVMFSWYSESCYYIDGTLLFAPMRHLMKELDPIGARIHDLLHSSRAC